MKLEEAKKIVTEYQKWCRGDAPYKFSFEGKFMHPEAVLYEATDALLAAVTVTDKMVERVLDTVVAEGETVYWSIVFGLQGDTDEVRAIMSREIIRTALTAAFGE